MPNRQKHRGQHPSDPLLFGEKQLPFLKEALFDFQFLIDRQYAEASALQLAGNRYKLNERQRKALMRVACSQTSQINRKSKEIKDVLMLKDQEVWIDGYNLLISAESLLAGGLVFKTREGCYRDIAGLHGTYKSVEETPAALRLIARYLNNCEIRKACWFFDSPVSNSGRLKQKMEALAQEENLPWEIHLSQNPDKNLVQSGQIVISSDGWVIEQAKAWFNFIDFLLTQEPHLQSSVKNFLC